MRYKLFALATVVAVGTVGLVHQAAADDRGGGGGGWWEKMSGPGKWIGGSGFYSLCLKEGPTEQAKDNDIEFCPVNDARLWLNLAGSYYATGSEEGEELRSPDLKVVSFEPSIDYRVTNLRENRFPVFVGLGAGIHFFSGTDVDLTRASLEPRISIMPWVGSRWYFEVRFAPKIFFKGFTAEDFGDPTGRFTSDGTDFVPAWVFILGIH